LTVPNGKKRTLERRRSFDVARLWVDALGLAADCGADYTVNSSEKNVATVVGDLTDGERLDHGEIEGRAVITP